MAERPGGRQAGGAGEGDARRKTGGGGGQERGTPGGRSHRPVASKRFRKSTTIKQSP